MKRQVNKNSYSKTRLKKTGTVDMRNNNVTGGDDILCFAFVQQFTLMGIQKENNSSVSDSSCLRRGTQAVSFNVLFRSTPLYIITMWDVAAVWLTLLAFMPQPLRWSYLWLGGFSFVSRLQMQ